MYTYWGDTLQYILKYKRPQLLNLKLTTYTSYKNIFVAPIFMNPGRQHYLIQYAHEKNELYRLVADFRDEEIAGYSK